MKSQINIKVLLPVLFSFYVMGFVDVVGIATSYVKQDFDLSNSVANLLPTMVFLWFAIFSFPTGILMGRIGRKKTVMLSAIVTLGGMLLPLVHYNFTICLVAFALLGIGNTILQVSLNPLIIEVSNDKSKATSMLVFGQFFKAISSTMGPIALGLLTGYFGSWKLIFPTYAAITLISWIWLYFTKIQEQPIKADDQGGLKRIASLFKDRYMIMLFVMIVLIVGFEIGLMTAIPKYLLECCGTSLEDSGFICSYFYIAKTAGAFLGAILLARLSAKRFGIITMVASILSLVAFMTLSNQVALAIAVVAMGLLLANIFGIIFSAAMQYKPEISNEASALMIMGVAGGAIIAPVMGIIADVSNEHTSLYALAATLLYLLFALFKLRIK